MTQNWPSRDQHCSQSASVVKHVTPFGASCFEMHWPPSLSKQNWPRIGCGAGAGWICCLHCSSVKKQSAPLGACCINAQMLPSCLQHCSHSASVVKHVTPFGASCFEMHWPPSLSKQNWPRIGCGAG